MARVNLFNIMQHFKGGFMVSKLILILFPLFTWGQYSTNPQYDQGVFSSENFIKNFGAEFNDLYVTDANGIHSRSTSSPIQGKASHLIDAATSGHLVKFTTKAIDGITAGGNCEAIFYVSGDASLYKTAVFLSTTNLTGAYTQLQNVSTGSRKVQLFFPCGASGDQPDIEIQATDNAAAAIKVDGVYLGKCIDCINAGATLTAKYTVSASKNGTTTNPWDFDTKVYDNYNAVTTSPTAWKFTAPKNGVYSVCAGGFAISTANIEINLAKNGTVNTVIASSSTTTSLFSGCTSISLAAGDYIDLRPNGSTYGSGASAYITINGLFNDAAIRLDQSNFDWATETCTSAWTTNTTNACKTRRIGSDLYVRHKLTLTGAPDSATLVLTIPGSRTIDTTKIPGTISTSSNHALNCSILDSGTNTFPCVAVYATTSTLTIRYLNDASTAAPFVNVTQAAPMTFASGDTVEIEYKVPITGWSENQNVPLLVGSRIVQTKYTVTGAVATGTTTIPLDDTIPQNTEGTQFMTLAITPKNISNLLKISVVVQADYNASAVRSCALFQDSTANALAAIAEQNTSAGVSNTIIFTHWMVAGTVAETTFKVRCGGDNAGTFTFNGRGGGRIYGGVLASSITIEEYAPNN